MSGGGGATSTDARAALQALLSKSAPPEKAAAPDAAGREEQAASALRYLFRADIQRALRPPKAAERLAEAEGQVRRLLEKAQVAQNGAKGAGSNNFTPPARSVPPELLVEEVRRQVEESENFVEEPPKDEPSPTARRRTLVREETGVAVEMLRQQVNEARRRLEDYDKQVTRLTKELRQCRSSVWEHQRAQSATEAQIGRLIAERMSELPPGASEELRLLDEEERHIVQELGEARAKAARWSSMAKRQDTMLQQEREATRGDAQSILMKHPAGEVFLARHGMRETDSEDGYSDGPPGPRGYPGRRPARADDDDEDYDGRAAASRGPGGRPVGIRAGDADSAQDSDSSVPPSPQDGSTPSSASLSGSASASASGGLAASLAAAAAAGAPTRAAGRAGAGRAGESSSEDEGEAARNWRQQVVPPVDIAGNRGRAYLRDADAAEEVSSEEGFEAEEETSRSV